MIRWAHEELINLRPFQRRFIKSALRPGILVSALSCPRGQGKTTLAAWLTLQTLVPGSPLFEAGAENHLVAASVAQSRRTTFGVLRRMVEALPGGGIDYSVADNAVSARIKHVATRTEVSVLAASGRAAMGLVNSRWIVCDEPASWKPSDGALMADAILDSHGKPDSDLRTLFIGTLAPAGEGHWWTDLVGKGSDGSTHVSLFQGVRDRWDAWPTIRKANPLMSCFPTSRSFLLEQRDKARTDPRLKARFLSYRLNLPTRDESEVVLTVGDWQRTLAREVPPREGRPVVGVDLGGGRAWSAAAGIWPNGRTEAVALIPGIPNVRAQEKRDQVQPGSYQRLVGQGSVVVGHGLRMPSVSALVEDIREWRPSVVVCDRFRLAELRDADPPCPIVTRVSRWSESTEDIQSLRRMASDGPLSVAGGSRQLIQTSLAGSKVVADDAGNVRLSKSSANYSRDDVTAALILAAGEWKRRRLVETPVWVFASTDGQIQAV